MSETTLSPTEIDLAHPPFPLTAIDRELLSMRDEDFHRITWSDLQTIIASNTLENLKRRPSDLRRYLAWSHDIKQRYGGIAPFVVQERLKWKPIRPAGPTQPPQFAYSSAVPFADRADYAVLLNDWPYGFAEGIRHLLVWTKSPIAVDDQRGDVTSESREQIEDFIREYFVEPLGESGKDQVLWFKNWVSLQSVRGVDHVHVLVRDVSEEQLSLWTQRHDV